MAELEPATAIEARDVDALCAILAGARWSLFMECEERWYRADAVDLGFVTVGSRWIPRTAFQRYWDTRERGSHRVMRE